ncbi:MAG: NAD(P)-dependent oxidoreductase [Myxococcales bacterium]|nr:NAD(P)-dependent oxidoreductase [Myxococcales bacterium]
MNTVTNEDKPRLIVTGASGFLGRRLLKQLHHRYHIIAIDRRSRSEAALAGLSNVEWHGIDIADESAVATTFDQIRREGSAKALIHLAAWYDFTGEEHVEYTRTNVEGTRLLLEACEPLGLERFVFASSLAACSFLSSEPLTEASPTEGDHVYARSKRAGEALMRETKVPTCIVRLAALFSDWCEYPPLYVFLETWLSRSWNRSVLGGRGTTSVPYLHVRDAADCFIHAVERGKQLDHAEVLLASPDGATDHAQLFSTTTEYAEGAPRKAWHVPAPLAWVGMWGRDLAGRVVGQRPFERAWMADYIDTQLRVDAHKTRERLRWAPRPRLGVLRRLPFMVENMRANQVEWTMRNREAMSPVEVKANYRIYRLLEKHQEEIETRFQRMLAGEGGARIPHYEALDDDERRWTSRVAMRNLIHAVRTGERNTFMQFARDVALRRSQQEFSREELIQALRALDWICLEVLRGDPEGALLGRALHDYVTMSIEFGIDRVLEVYEDADTGAWH